MAIAATVQVKRRWGWGVGVGGWGVGGGGVYIGDVRVVGQQYILSKASGDSCDVFLFVKCCRR